MNIKEQRAKNKAQRTQQEEIERFEKEIKGRLKHFEWTLWKVIKLVRNIFLVVFGLWFGWDLGKCTDRIGSQSEKTRQECQTKYINLYKTTKRYLDEKMG
jgi:hypothetical protein